MSSLQWYSFTDIPDEYFFKLLGPVCVKQIQQAVNVFDEISTLQGLERDLNKEWLRPSYTKLASLYSLFKKRYVVLAITGDRHKDLKSDTVLFGPDNLTEEIVSSDKGTIVAECNFDSLYTKFRQECPYYNLSAMITKSGEEWISEMKDKYPELFEPQMDIMSKLSSGVSYPVDFPENYSKKGTINLEL